MNIKKLLLIMMKNEESNKVVSANNLELAKLIGVTYEEARRMKESAIVSGMMVTVKDESTGYSLLRLTPKGKAEALKYQSIPTIHKSGAPTVRRVNPVRSLSTPEKAHFVKQFNQLDNGQLAFYHLILANALGVYGFNYLNFKFLNGVLKISPIQVQQNLRELEDLGLIKLEGSDGNSIKLAHSYNLLSDMFPDYCEEKNDELNNYLKRLCLNPQLVKESQLHVYKGKDVKQEVASEKEVDVNKFKAMPKQSALKPENKIASESVLSSGELRHHTTQNHSSMPEVDYSYWNQQQIRNQSYFQSGMTPNGISPMQMPGIQPNLNPYQTRRNPLTILIDGDQQSLKGFMKEAKLDRLRSGDSIYLFSASGAHSNLSTELVQRIEELKENVYFKRITSEIRRSNTMDHLIIARLTMLLTADFNRDFIILSEDKGFAGAITMLNDTYNLRRGQIQLQTIAIL